MAEAKRPRGTDRSATSKKTTSSRAGSAGGAKASKTTRSKTTSKSSGSARSGSTSRGSAASRTTKSTRTTGSSSAKKPAKTTKKPAKPSPAKSSQRDELEPLDFDGTDFEELLGAGHADEDDAGESRHVDEDFTEPDNDPYASIRPGRRATLLTESPFGEAGDDDDGDERATAAFAGADTAGAASLGAGSWSPPTLEHDLASVGDDDEERPSADELIVGGLGLLIAILSMLLPWYELGAKKMTPVATGGLGVIPFAAGLGAVAIVALRRFGVAIRYPFQTGVVLEVLGYVAVAATILKPLVQRETSYELVRTNQWIILGLGVALALMAGRLSSGAPLVARPGWLKDRAGVVGLAVLLAVVAVGGVLAVTKPGRPSDSAAPNGTQTAFSDEPPACIEDANFPLLDVLIFEEVGGRPPFFVARGVDGRIAACGASFRSEIPMSELRERWMRALRANDWTADATLGEAGGGVIALTSPRCGQVILTPRPASEGGPVMGSFSFLECGIIGGVPQN